jgi:hypothetical protein
MRAGASVLVGPTYEFSGPFRAAPAPIRWALPSGTFAGPAV